MRSLGAADLLVLLVFVALVFDSRRFHALARATGRGRRECIRRHELPPGADADRVGLSLRQIQMRHHVDWGDGAIGWDGPEILPVDEPDDGDASEAERNRVLPVLWKPFPALPAAGGAGVWAQAVTPALRTAESSALAG